MSAEIADSLGLKEARGAIVDNPQDGSPAAKAGIEAGDVITAVNGTAIKDSRDLARTIATLAPGTSVKLDVVHKGESKTVTLALGELPNERQAKADEGKAQPNTGTPRLGLSLAPAGDVQGAGQKGVVVTEVDPQDPPRNAASRPATSFSMSAARPLPMSVMSAPSWRRPNRPARTACCCR